MRVILASFLFLLCFLARANEPLRTEPYQIWLDEDFKISRTGALGEALTWVIVKNGETVLARDAANELAYTYFDNQLGNEYFAYLQKWGGQYYVRVSNIVGYRFGLDSQAPIITSPRYAVEVVGNPFHYVIKATQAADVFTASNLPPGLVLDERGVISGIPTETGNYDIVLTAANGRDVGTSSLVLSVVSGENDGGYTDLHTLVLHSNYSVTWNQLPNETNLVMMVQRNGSIVLGRNVLGVSHDGGYHDNRSGYTYSIHLESSSFGRVSNIVYYQPGVSQGFPLITSSLAAAGQLGEAFAGYQILAQNSPTSFSAIGLPTGLEISSSGYISGVPSETGTFRVQIGATNAVGTDRKTLTLSINQSDTPDFFINLIMDPDGVVRRSAGNLPGLTWVVQENGVSVLRRLVRDELALSYYRAGVVSSYTVHLEAWLNGAYRKVSNTVGKNLPTLAFVGSSRMLARVGQPVTDYVIRLSVPYDTLSAGELPEGLVLNGATISGTPVNPGIFAVMLSATAGAGSASQLFVIEVLPVAEQEAPIDTFVLRIDANHTVSRTAGSKDGLAWVVTKDGHQVHRRPAKAEDVFTYHRNFIAGEFTVHLEARVDGRATRVSNIVGYRTPDDDGSPVFASPRRLQLITGRAFSHTLLASGAPTLYQASGLPQGVTLSADGILGGTPVQPGKYAVTFTATTGQLMGDMQGMLNVVSAPTTGGYQDRHQLVCDENLVVHRSPGGDPNLTWVVYRDGTECLSKLVNEEREFRYHRNFEPGTYTVRLEAFLGGEYRIVSNVVTYTVSDEPGHELMSHALGAVNGSETTYVSPTLSVGQFADGSPAVCLTYTVNRADGAVTATLEQSTDLSMWTAAEPVRRILAADETFELREDLVPMAAGGQKFHRVKLERASP